jgi:hypothetical protein
MAALNTKPNNGAKIQMKPSIPSLFVCVRIKELVNLTGTSY